MLNGSRLKGVCPSCRKRRKGIDVYHTNYRSLGDEDLNALVILCPACYSKFKGRPPNAPKKPITPSTFYESSRYDRDNADTYLEELSKTA